VSPSTCVSREGVTER